MLSTQDVLRVNSNNRFTADDFLNRKKIDKTIFNNNLITFKSPLSQHSSFAFDHFYSIPYSINSAKKITEHNSIARFYHGIAHANRVANYIPIFANLYRRYDDKAALGLTNDDVKLLQIAAFFHDAAREQDGVDEWDKDSGVLLYLYLTSIGINEKKAILLAEAIANKDADETSGYYEELHISADGKLAWEKAAAREKNVYQFLLHDSDCIDIIRARDHFKGKKLDFFKKIAIANSAAFAEMAQLITEVRSVIEQQGDSRLVPDTDKKRIYEQRDSYARSLQLFKFSTYNMLSTLLNNNQLRSQDALKMLPLIDKEPYDPSKELDVTNLKRAMQEGKVFARGMVIVSGKSAKKITREDGEEVDETLSALELRKAARRLGVPTTSSKPNKDGSKPNIEKEANPDRSVCMLGYGATPFSDAGFLLVNPNTESITSVSIKDSDTGFGKKKHFSKYKTKSTNINIELMELRKSLMQGGSSRQFRSITATHNEITCNIDHFDAIYFTQDPNFANLIYTNKPTAFHRYAPILSAFYLQAVYLERYGKRLPIFEYSGLHNSLRQVEPKEQTDAAILQMWASMIQDYLHSQKSFALQASLLNKKSIDKLKILAMYGAESFDNSIYRVKSILPPDHYYSKELRQALSDMAAVAIDAAFKNTSDFCKLVIAQIADDDDAFFAAYENLPPLNNSSGSMLSFNSIRDFFAEYLLRLQDEKIIDEVIENKSLFHYVMRQHSVFHLIDNYWQRHQKPVIDEGFINFSDLWQNINGGKLLAAINTGKLTGYEQDEYGRYLRVADPSSHLMTHKNSYYADLTGRDFSKFNFHHYTFVKFKIQATSWRFVKLDKVIFTKCYMDDFSCSKDSDLSGVIIKEPIFSSNAAAKKVANLFATIPPFILENQYIEEVKELIKEGKKIHFDNYNEMHNRLVKMIVDNEFALFCLVLGSLTEDCDYADHFEELLVKVINTESLSWTRCRTDGDFFTAIWQSIEKQEKAEKHKNDNVMQKPIINNENRFAFAEVMIKNHVIKRQTKQYHHQFIMSAIKAKNYPVLRLLLSHDAKPCAVLSEQSVFRVMHDLLNLPNDGSLAYEENAKINLAKAHANYQLPFYAIAERMIYICAYLGGHVEMTEANHLAATLIADLKRVYDQHLAKKNIFKALQQINEKQMYLLHTLKQDDALLQKAWQVNVKGIDRFDAYVSSHSVNFTAENLSQDDIADLCVYLQQNPSINKVIIRSNQLTAESIALLTFVSSVHKLTFSSCHLNEEAMKILAKAPYLNKLMIDEQSNKTGITINAIKALASNVNIKALECRYGRQDKAERKAWKKIMRETDPAIRANFAAEAEKGFAIEKKLSKLQAHEARLEAQFEHVGQGTRARYKKNILREQILFFRDEIASLKKQSKTDEPSDKINCQGGLLS